MAKTTKIKVQNTEISVLLDKSNEDYICLTDMARYKDNDPSLIISHWMRLGSTMEFLATWEAINNPNFKPTEFGRFKEEASSNSFTMTPKKWVQSTDAIGIFSKAGRYGGTYAHKDIAFNFGMWLSPVFQLYVVKEFQRLKESESNPLIEQWDVRRIISKANYTIHTDAVQKFVLPKLSISKTKERIVYATEADTLNLAVFGYTAKDWEEANPLLHAKRLNMRDTASINQLVVLSNMESMNAELIKVGYTDRRQRLQILHKAAKGQLEVLDRTRAEQKFRKLAANGEEQKLIE